MAASMRRKLFVGEDVEARDIQMGFRGSWHAGVVIEVNFTWRWVEYKEYVNEEDHTKKLVHPIKISEEEDGIELGRDYRGRIRPPPPALENSEERWTYGLCVDAFYEDGWWEGILLDNLENCEERLVFFPDEGDALKVHRNNLRVTRDWNEVFDYWTVRGHWVLATLREHFERAGLAIGVVWHFLQDEECFQIRMPEWTAAAREQDVWLPYVKKAVQFLVAHPEKQKFESVNSFSTEAMKLAYLCSNVQIASSSGLDMNVQSDCFDRVLAIRADSKEQTGKIDRFFSNDLGNDAGSKDQMNFTNATELSHHHHHAFLKFNLILNKNSKKEDREEAKMHLLALGWEISSKARLGKRKCDALYVSPTGAKYYSLYQACLAWENEQKLV